MIDLTQMSRLVARITEELMDSRWDEIRTAAVILEVEDELCREIKVFASDDRSWVTEKFLDKALSIVERKSDRLEALAELDADDEDED